MRGMSFKIGYRSGGHWSFPVARQPHLIFRAEGLPCSSCLVFICAIFIQHPSRVLNVPPPDHPPQQQESLHLSTLSSISQPLGTFLFIRNCSLVARGVFVLDYHGRISYRTQYKNFNERQSFSTFQPIPSICFLFHYFQSFSFSSLHFQVNLFSSHAKKTRSF